MAATSTQNVSFITSLQKHELKSFNKLYDDYAPAYYGEIKRSLYQKELCDQTLHETFVQIWNTLNGFDPAKERLSTWCLKIVQKEIRKKKIDLMLKEIFTCQQHPAKKEFSVANLRS